MPLCHKLWKARLQNLFQRSFFPAVFTSAHRETVVGGFNDKIKYVFWQTDEVGRPALVCLVISSYVHQISFYRSSAFSTCSNPLQYFCLPPSVLELWTNMRMIFKTLQRPPWYKRRSNSSLRHIRRLHSVLGRKHQEWRLHLVTASSGLRERPGYRSHLSLVCSWELIFD